MIVQQIQKRMLVSLTQLANDLNLKEGDHLKIEHVDGTIVLTPVSWIPKSQEYFWTEAWQEKMRASKEALEKGEYEVFDNEKNFFESLDNLGSSNNEDTTTDSH